MGPQSRDILAKVSPNDFSNAAHPFGTAREIEIGMGLARYGHRSEALRILTGLYETASAVPLFRLPELFCGFPAGFCEFSCKLLWVVVLGEFY